MKRLLIAIVAIPAIVAAQATAPAPAGNAENGKSQFMEKNCYYCHGTTGQGGRDGARITNTLLNADGLIRFVRKPTGAMPAYSEKLISDQELRDILAYLKSLPAAKPPNEIPILNQLSNK